MHHIEFLGPSGSGKTTLRRELVSRLPKALGGTDGIYKCCHRMSNLAVLFKYWPDKAKKQFWKRYLRPRFQTAYEKAHPETLEIRQELIDVVGTDTISSHTDEEMATYQLYKCATQANESVVIDDGLYQFHLHLVEHDIYNSLSSFLPAPDVLVCTYASPETCLDRQESRDRGRAKMFVDISRENAIKRLDKLRQATDRVAMDLKDQDTIVIQVSTENTVSKAYNHIYNNLPKRINDNSTT